MQVKNKSPQKTVLRPVLAPALIPAADSGDISTGGPPNVPDNMVKDPQIIYNHLLRGIAPSWGLVNCAISLNVYISPLINKILQFE